MSSSRSEQIELFRELIEQHFGLSFDQTRTEQLVETYEARLADLKKRPSEYLLLLRENSGEWNKLAALLTIPETYFFRGVDQLRAFEDIVLPARVRHESAHRTLRILSVGCATGEEPYTIAISCRARSELLAGWTIEIIGLDLNDTALEKARAGVYGEWSLRATPAWIRDAYFEKAGKRYRLKQDLIASTAFVRGNIMQLSAEEYEKPFDVVFFRNVLMYFSPEAASFAINRIAHALHPGGYLFLGAAESLRGLSEDFHLCHTNDACYYQRKPVISRRSERVVAATASWTVGASQLSSFPAPLNLGLDDVSWFEGILESGRRIRELEDQHRGLKTVTPTGTLAVSASSEGGSEQARQTLLRFLREERHDEALCLLKSLPDDIRKQQDILLLDVVLTLNTGDGKSAHLRCRQLLDLDEMNATAHYAMALCSDQESNYDDAVFHDRIAIYLDPNFAMPHLHLGVLSKKKGDPHLAKREFREAIRLIPRELDTRLLLFSGGFGSRTLLQFCEQEVRSLEAA
jgi:chemotaxis protein methyltransferase CheR